MTGMFEKVVQNAGTVQNNYFILKKLKLLHDKCYAVDNRCRCNAKEFDIHSTITSCYDLATWILVCKSNATFNDVVPVVY